MISRRLTYRSTGSLDGDRKIRVNAKAEEPREIAKAPTNTISEPVAATATISGAHVGDTEVVPNEGYDYDYWAWNELPPTPSEPPISPEPSTASAPQLKGQQPTVDNGDNTLLEIARLSDSITRILQSASDSSSTASASASTLTPIPTATTINPPSHLSPFSYSFPATSSYSSPAPPRRFQRSPFFGKKIGVTPRVSRIRSVSGALDPGMPAFESPTGPTLVAGSENESERHSEDGGGTLIEPEGYETFGAENGGRPFVGRLADLRQAFRLPPCKHDRPPPIALQQFFFFLLINATLSLAPAVPAVRAASAIASPPPSKEAYQRAFAMLRELRGSLELT